MSKLDLPDPQNSTLIFIDHRPQKAFGVANMAKQARIQGLIAGHRRQQQDFVRALEQTGIRPVIGDR